LEGITCRQLSFETKRARIAKVRWMEAAMDKEVMKEVYFEGDGVVEGNEGDDHFLRARNGGTNI
jgi:hypothetical protein